VPLYLGCWVTQIPNLCLVVSDGPWWSSTDTVACILRCKCILSCASFSFRVPSSSQPHESLARSCASRGVRVPHDDINTWSPLFAGHPAPDDVPPAAFRTLSTVCSSSCLARLFHRAAVSRVLASGVASSVRAAPPRRWPLPSRRWRRLPTGCPAPAERRVDLRVLLSFGVRCGRSGG
jgi:hypothetical protein